MQKQFWRRKGLTGETKHLLKKCFTEPTVSSEVGAVSYFDWQIIEDHD